ncbi:hypothetical protein ACQKPE_17310 [Pseudomonas sp. NPDC089554]|uniref:hypothetical protein n=1 Tax=Pseudomonas sp. NPDC089554 TaxID=3390653 RepID=UPI003CFF4456
MHGEIPEIVRRLKANCYQEMTLARIAHKNIEQRWEKLFIGGVAIILAALFGWTM